jgi:glucokinase
MGYTCGRRRNGQGNELSENKNWAAALDLGATSVSAGLVSAGGEIREKRSILTHDPADPRPLRLRLIELAAGLIERAAAEGIALAGIGVGAPGIVDSDKGVLVVAGNLPELLGLPLGPELAEEFGLPVYVENDVNAQALGEMAFGVARGKKNFVMFSIGTDLGGGIVIDGRLHPGAHFIAAEFGHLTLDLSGKPCVCGGVGCAREYVSGAGISDRARDLLSDSSAAVKNAGDRKAVTAKMVFQAARDLDPEASKLVSEFSRRFGAVIANVMKVLDPEMVVLAGEIIRKEPQLISDIVHWTRHYYFPIPQLPDFRASELSKETAVLGPAAAFFSAHGIPAGPEHHHHKKG